MKSFLIASIIVSFVLVPLFFTGTHGAGYDPAIAQLQNQVRQLSDQMQQVINMMNVLTNTTIDCRNRYEYCLINYRAQENH
jgi:hypothetical protein